MNQMFQSRRQYNGALSSSWTRVCLHLAGAEGYISSITGLIFKVCFGALFVWYWSPLMIFLLRWYIIWIMTTVEIKQPCEPLQSAPCDMHEEWTRLSFNITPTQKTWCFSFNLIKSVPFWKTLRITCYVLVLSEKVLIQLDMEHKINSTRQNSGLTSSQDVFNRISLVVPCDAP